jgi:hypothetical protein
MPLSPSAPWAREMFMHILADYIWISGGTLALIIIVLLVVLIMRKGG